jgi:hypothetical protein
MRNGSFPAASQAFLMQGNFSIQIGVTLRGLLAGGNPLSHYEIRVAPFDFAAGRC